LHPAARARDPVYAVDLVCVEAPLAEPEPAAVVDVVGGVNIGSHSPSVGFPKFKVNLA
jgi:hypothetical protein